MKKHPSSLGLALCALAAGFNLAASAVQYDASCGPGTVDTRRADLRVASLDTALQALAASTQPVAWTVLNQGAAPASGGWVDRVYLSTNAAGNNGRLLGEFPASGPLGTNQSLPRFQTTTLPADLETDRDYWWVVVTDAANAIDESNEANNTRVSDQPMRLLRSPMPNLRVTAVGVSASPMSGQPVTVTWAVTNAGTWSTGAGLWQDAVYVSATTNVDGTAFLLGRTQRPRPLGTNDAYAGSLATTLPQGLSGTRYFIVQTDADNRVNEGSFENDNTTASAPVAITLTPPPDLRVAAIQTPTNALSGAILAVSWTITNAGPGLTEEAAWYDDAYLSTTNVLGTNAVLLGSFLHEGVLTNGRGYTVSASVPVPASLSGTFYLLVQTDARSNVFEDIFETNNAGVSAPIVITLTPPPDLAVSQVTAPATALASHPVTVGYTVTNSGADTLFAFSWEDHLYLATNAASGARTFLSAQWHLGDLFAGESYTNTFTATLPDSLSGSFYAIVETDAGGQVFELNRTNNTRASATPILVESRPADLVVTGLDAPTAAQAGSSLLLSWSVRNQGSGDTAVDRWSDRWVLSSDAVFGNADDVTLLTLEHVGLLPAGGSYGVSSVVATIPWTVAPGSYRLFLATDSGDGVYEAANEGNNVSAPHTITISRTIADLGVASVTLSPPRGEGQGEGSLPALSEDTLLVSWRVENTGLAAPNSTVWSDAVYLSTNAVWSTNSVLLGINQNPSSPAPGAFYTNTLAVTLPAEIQGNFFVHVVADAADQVIESSEVNNSLAATNTLQITLRPVPDLAVVSVATPADGFSGQLFELSWTVTNRGSATAEGTWYDSVYLSLDPQFEPDLDTYIGYAERPHVLTNGQSYTQTAQLEIPTDVSGLFYVFVVCDSTERVNERGATTNNVGRAAAAVSVWLQPPADLVVGTITIPTNAVAGYEMALTYVLRNQGTNGAFGPWVDALYLSADDQWDIGDTLFTRVSQTGFLAAGGSRTNTVSAPAPGVLPGNYHVIIRTDIVNQVPETNEFNNITATLDQVAAQVEKLSFGIPRTGAISPGQFVYYRFDATNEQTIRLAFAADVPASASQLLVRFGAIPTRGEFDFTCHEPFVSAGEVVLAVERTGTYFVLVYGGLGTSPFTIQAELLPLAITRASPSVAGNAGLVTLKVEGALFKEGMIFALTNGSGTSLPAAEVRVQDSATAYVTFNCLGVPPGSYALAAQVPIAGFLIQTGLTNALTLQAGMGARVMVDFDGDLQLRAGSTIPLKVHYQNVGDADTMAPLILVDSPAGWPLGFSPGTLATKTLQVLGLSQDGPMDILRVGTGGLVPLCLRPAAGATAAGIRARAILADDRTVLTEPDWQQIEGSVRPSAVNTNTWLTLWANIRARMGTTWGDYVQMLDRLDGELSSPSDPIVDVRELFARLCELNPRYRPSSSMAGWLRDSGSGAGLPGISVTVSLREQGQWQRDYRVASGTEGRFLFPNLMPGTYDIVVEGLDLDLDRNGKADQGFAVYVVPDYADVTNATLYCLPKSQEPPPVVQDTAPSLTLDGMGRLHLVWSRNEEIWHAVTDGTGWTNPGRVADASGYDPKIVWGAKLFEGQSPGLRVVWQTGTGNDAKLFSTVGRETNNTCVWNTPQPLTSDAHGDAAAALILSPSEEAVVLWLQRDYSIEDDDDLYYLVVTNAPGSLWVGPQAPIPGIWLAPKDGPGIGRCWGADLDSEKVRIPLLGKAFKFTTSGEVCFNVALCSAEGSGQLIATTELGDYVGIGVGVGSAAKVTARRSKSLENCEWEFDYLKIGPRIQGEFHFPWPALSFKVPWVSVDAGLRVTLGGGGDMTWKGDDFRWWPPNEASLFVELGGGPYGRAKWWSRHGEVYGEIKGRFTYTKPPGRWAFDGITVRACFKSNAHSIRDKESCWEFGPVFGPEFKAAVAFASSARTVNTESLLPQHLVRTTTSNDNGVPGTYTETDTIHVLIGTGATYEGHPVLGDIGSDVKDDGRPSVAKSAAGELLVTWTKDSANPLVAIGSAVVVAAYTGAGWSVPIVLDGPTNFNTDPAVAFDSGGSPMVVWGSAPANVTLSNSVLELDAAMKETDMVYSRRISGVWTSPLKIAPVTGRDSGTVLTAGLSGILLAAWLNATESETAVYAALWNGLAWGAAVKLSTGSFARDPAVAFVGGRPTVVWSQDADGDPQTEGDNALWQSTFIGQWSSPSPITELLPATAASAQAARVKAIAKSALPFPLSLPVPTECCECKQTKHVTRGSGDCVVGTEVDPETCTETTTYKPCVLRAVDPNDIVGPSAFGSEQWVSAEDTLRYTIRFENDPKKADLPAQIVRITQQLDPNLDFKSFRLGDIGFGDTLVAVPESRVFYQTRVNVTNQLGVLVDIVARIDLATGELYWEFTSIDPATGDLPWDIFAGFLPPNTNGIIGQGFVSYTIKPKAGIASGDIINAEARIFFDYNEPMDTPHIFNTVDASLPTSTVLALPATTNRNVFPVQWGGADAYGGAGIGGFDIYVADNSGPWQVWLQNTPYWEQLYVGECGHTYGFYSVARDNVGNREVGIAAVQAQIYVLPNTPPVLEPVTNCLVAVGQTLSITNRASDADAGQQVTYSLAAGAPDGMSVDPQSGVLDWTPACVQGGSTNSITVIATDDGCGSLSSSRPFTVVVTECLQTSLGRAVGAPGGAGCVPVSLESGFGLTNLTFTVSVPGGRFTNFTVSATAPEVASATVVSHGGTQAVVVLAAKPGQVLRGPKQFAQVCFALVPGQHSAFARMEVQDILGLRENGTPIGNASGYAGRTVVVGEEPLLECVPGTNGQPLLLLYGKPASGYAIDTRTNITAGSWRTALTNLTVGTSLSLSISPPASSSPANFYRALRAVPPEPPRLAARIQSPGQIALTLYGTVGTSYGIEFATVLGGGTNWHVLAPSILLTNQSQVLSFPTGGAPATFYRARVN